MLSQRARDFSFSEPVVQFTIACGVGLVLGLASLMLSPLWVLAALVGGVLAILVLKRPELGILGILSVTSTLIDLNAIPSVGPASVKIVDLAFWAMFGLIVLRWVVEEDFTIVRTPLDLPLVVLFAVASFSSAFAFLASSIQLWEVWGELRILSYYMIFFLVTNLVRDERQLSLLIDGFLFVATVVAIVMLFQFALGKSAVIMSGRVETLVTQRTEYREVTRILPPGQSLVLVACITLMVILILERLSSVTLFHLAQCGLSTLAVVLTFNRSFWVGVGLALILLTILLRGRDFQHYVTWGISMGVVGAISFAFIFAQPNSKTARLISASTERLTTLVGDTPAEDDSFKWRYPEYEYALAQMTKRPLLGLGMGSRYRPLDSRLDSEHFDGTKYIHNGHLYIILKSGFLGYFCLVWLSVIFLSRGVRYWRQIPHPKLRGTVLGFTLTYIGVIAGSIVAPMFMDWFWTPVLGIMMGVNEVVFRLYRGG